MGNLTNTQKAKIQAQMLYWQEQAETAAKDGTPPVNYDEEGKAALKKLEALKRDFQAGKEGNILNEFNGEFAKAVAATTLMFQKNIVAAKELNDRLNNFAEKKLGLNFNDVHAFMRTISNSDLKSREFMPSPEEDFEEMKKQLGTKEPEKKAPAPEEKPAPKPEEKKEPEKAQKAEPEKPAEEAKPLTWQDQKNLPTVKGTMPAVVIEGALKLAKPENPEDKIPFNGTKDAQDQVKAALDEALRFRGIFQESRTADSRDGFYRNLSSALLHFSRLSGRIESDVTYEVGKIANRLTNEFGFSRSDIKRATTAIYGSEHGGLRVWAPGDEKLIEDRLLKIGAPNLESTEIVEQVKAKEKAPVQNKPAEERAVIAEEVQEKANDDRISIAVDVEEAKPFVREPVKPSLPFLTRSQIAEMQKWKEKLANAKENDIVSEYVNLMSSFPAQLKDKNTKDATVGRLVALVSKFEGGDNPVVANGAKNILFDNTPIPLSEIQVAAAALKDPEADVMKELVALKAREFEEKYKVPDEVKNFPYAKQMIDVNSKFFDNRYDIPKNDFLAFAGKHMKTLQEKAKNPNAANGADSQKELLNASVGMYARLRAAHDKRGFFDVLRHPIDSYRERSLLKDMAAVMSQSGMQPAQIEALYTDANRIFGLDKLNNAVSLNGKSAFNEIHDKLIDVNEPETVKDEEIGKGQENPDRERVADLDAEMKKFEGRDKMAENKEIEQPAIKEPTKEI